MQTTQSKNSTQQIVVRVTSQEKTYWENIAQKNDTTLSALVREALNTFTQKKYNFHKNNHLLQLANIGESKTATKQPKNISTNYKKHLYGDI